MQDNGYAGKIKNGGTQVVKAPKQTTDPRRARSRRAATSAAARSKSRTTRPRGRTNRME